MVNRTGQWGCPVGMRVHFLRDISSLFEKSDKAVLQNAKHDLDHDENMTKIMYSSLH
jgi:hypothetical protein